MRDNFARALYRQHVGKYGGAGALGEKTREVHRALMEGGVWGYDILETAAHLTATTLGMMSPEVDFKKAHIYRTIIGKTKAGAVAGSLEMLEHKRPLFDRSEQVETKTQTEVLPSVDLCIMNPPFVRGTGGNESFNFLPGEEQKAVQKRARDLGKKYGFSTDGQGPAFVALACQQRKDNPFIKPGGRLAIILPATAVAGTGPAWRKMRETIEKDFDLEVVIASRDTTRPNFSENTALQECIIICRKRKYGETPKTKALFVILHHNPRNGEEAMAATQAIRQAQSNNNEIGDLCRTDGGLFDGKMGQYASLSYYRKSAWRGVSFSNIHLAFAAENFPATGSLSPFVPSGIAPLVPLDSIATIGSMSLDKYINGSKTENPYAKIAGHKTSYAGYYPGYHHKMTGIKHSDIGQLAEKPQCYCLPLPGKEEWIGSYYKKAGRVIITQSFRLNSMRRLASIVSQPVQTSHCWPISLHNESEEKLKAITLWLNSTPALLLIVHACASTHGAKVMFSKDSATEMAVLDLEQLTPHQLKKLAAAFDAVVDSDGLLPLPRMETDPVRHQIDNAFCEVLGLGDLAPLRAALAAEPIITNKPIGQTIE